MRLVVDGHHFGVNARIADRFSTVQVARGFSHRCSGPTLYARLERRAPRLGWRLVIQAILLAQVSAQLHVAVVAVVHLGVLYEVVQVDFSTKFSASFIFGILVYFSFRFWPARSHALSCRPLPRQIGGGAQEAGAHRQPHRCGVLLVGSVRQHVGLAAQVADVSRLAGRGGSSDSSTLSGSSTQGTTPIDCGDLMTPINCGDLRSAISGVEQRVAAACSDRIIIGADAGDAATAGGAVSIPSLCCHEVYEAAGVAAFIALAIVPWRCCHWLLNILMSLRVGS